MAQAQVNGQHAWPPVGPMPPPGQHRQGQPFLYNPGVHLPPPPVLLPHVPQAPVWPGQWTTAYPPPPPSALHLHGMGGLPAHYQGPTAYPPLPPPGLHHLSESEHAQDYASTYKGPPGLAGNTPSTGPSWQLRSFSSSGSPSTAQTSPPAPLPNGVALPPSSSTTGTDRSQLSHFAPAFVPRWLRQVSEAPLELVPLTIQPKRMTMQAGAEYTRSLLPGAFLDAVDADRAKGQEAAAAQTKKVRPSIIRREWLLTLDSQIYQGAGSLLHAKSWQLFWQVAIPESRSVSLPSLPALSPTSYAARFLPLLAGEHSARKVQLEAAQMFLTDVAVHDRAQGLLSLEAKFIREGWPPVDIGDVVGLRVLFPERHCSADGLEYEARVWAIRRARGQLVLLCPAMIDRIPPTEASVPCNIKFSPQDHTFFQQHRAVELLSDALQAPVPSSRETGLNSTVGWLFPSEAYQTTWRIPDVDLAPWHDGNLNDEQKLAIASFALHHRRTPFLVSGAPGSGKTKLCVEAVLQILATDPSARVLLCGASNPSADTLAARLRHQLNPKTMFRLIDPGRSIDEARSEILPYTFQIDGLFAMPELEDLLAKRVVVSSCIDAALLDLARCSNSLLQRFHRYVHSHLGPPPSSSEPGRVRPHFTHLIVDEAGQASETELAVPFSVVLSDPSTEPAELASVLICGDVRQLGPNIVSEPMRQQYEFDCSLLQRLFERPFYADHRAARKLQKRTRHRPLGLDDCMHFVNLVRNYRSHPAIIALPSSLFYNDTLLACAPEAVQTTMLSSWHRLPRAQFPILFHDIDAAENFVDEGASWFNQVEVDVVVEMVVDLVKNRHVRPREVSVISPFREQVWRIRMSLRERDLAEVDVGNVEALQGAENRVVMISTVRSRMKGRITEDRKRNQGLIFEAQRFNVAMTRAKELLVVVGNAATLTIDPNWRSFYNYTVRNRAYEGRPVQGLEDASGAADISRLEESLRHASLANGTDVVDPDERTRHDGELVAGAVVRSLEMGLDE